MAKQRRRIMRSFKLDELSAVDKPAQEGALMTIMKRKGEALDTLLLKHFLSVGGVASLAHDRVLKGSGDADGAWPLFAALETSLHSVVNDGSLTDTTKVEMMKASVGDFLQMAKRGNPDIESHLGEALSSVGDKGMNLATLKKQMDGLGRQLDKLTANAMRKSSTSRRRERDEDLIKADATGEDEAADRLRNLLGADKNYGKEGEMPAFLMDEDEAEKADDEAEYMVTEEETEKGEDAENEKPTTEGEEEEPIAAGTTRPIGGGGEAGKRALKRERLDIIKLDSGRVIHKADLGDDDLFDVLKSQQRRVDELAKRADEERERREMLEFGKTADEHLAHLPGTADGKARVLKQLSKHLNKDERQLLSKMLIAGDRASSAAFRTHGHGGGGTDKFDKAAKNTFGKCISAIKARDGCSNVDAMRKARREHPEEYEAYQNGG